MGCNFNTMTLSGKFTEDQVRNAFSDEQDQDRYENGHSYSGGFGMATGLDFHREVGVFASYDEANDWLDENALKWGQARAVRFKQPSGEEDWLIGANCAS